MDRISELLAEQSSPVEVLVFLAVTVVLFLAVACLIYVVLMALLRPALPKEVPFRRVLLPDAKQLYENLADYVLAGGTSILLSLTLFVKHDLVEQIRNYDMSQVGQEAIAVLFDYGLPPDLADQVGKATLDEILSPMLEAGRVEESERLVRSIVTRLPPVWLSPAVLVSACVVLALFYLAWMSRNRFKALQKDPGSVPKYSGTVRRLMTLALCVGLLLASSLPLARGGEKYLARSALDAIEQARLDGQAGSEISRMIGAELSAQRDRAAAFFCPQCGVQPVSDLQGAGTIPADAGELDSLSERVDEAVLACEAKCASQVAALPTMLEPLRRRIAEVETRMSELANRLQTSDEEQRAELERLLALERRRWSQMSAEWAGRIGELARQIEPLGGLPERMEELERRVAWLESQHRARRVTEILPRDAACERYASLWVRQSVQNQELRCGLSGDRWSAELAIQRAACLEIPAEQRDPETERREAQLDRCRQRVR